MTLTLTDLFCGAGGSSTGAAQVPGIDVAVAVNHWPAAVAVHAANHPDAEHRTADISQLSPAMLPFTDLLWASPECQSYSQAAPVREEAAVARSRATGHDVIRFAEHRADRGRPYAAICVENVPEFATWRFFPTWLGMLDELGYDTRIVHLNSALASVGGPGAPQYRDRMYVVAWHRGLSAAPDFERWLSPPATCATCGPVAGKVAYRKPREEWEYRGVAGASGGRYRFQYDLACPTCGQLAAPSTRPALDALDLSLPGLAVQGRRTPLVAKTLTRIRAGIVKTWNTPAPDGSGVFVMRNNGSPGNGAEHCTPVTEPLRTMTTAGHQSVVTYDRTAPDVDAALASARMRWLAAHEIAAAMGFPPDYRLAGTLAEQRTMLGNAVTPPAARDLLSMVAEAVTGARLPVAA